MASRRSHGLYLDRLRNAQLELETLLSNGASELKLQTFLENHTEFIPRQFVQHHGITNDLAISQLRFGQDFISDLAFVTGSSDDFWIVLIELELPTAQFFKKNGKGQAQLHSDFRRGLEQIDQWRAWLTNSANLDHLYRHVLRPIVQSHIDRKVFVKYVLVTGRREMYAGSQSLQNLVAAKERDDFAIMTWDSLLEHPDKHYPLFVGKRRDAYIDILTKEFLSDRLFSWIDARAVRLNRSLREAAQPYATTGIVLPKSINEHQVRAETLDLMGNWD